VSVAPGFGVGRLLQYMRRGARPDLFQAMVRGNRVTLLHDGATCLPAMLEAIERAEREILLEMYWFGSDKTGQRFAKALIKKAKKKIPVCVIYDAVGSLEADDAMFDEMRAAGCDVREYNPIAPWRQRFHIGLVNHRDHRKILVVDQSVGLTGGVNIGDQWLPAAEGGGDWRDDMIRIEGVAALDMRDVFLHTWRELGGVDPCPTMTAAELRDSGVKVPEGGSPVRVLASHYRAARAAIRRSYIDEIRKATSHIYITNSYFVPDRVIRFALSAARSRGVEVKVLLPGESDVPAVFYAGRRLYRWLMTRGIELYEWQGTVLHAKTAVIDDRWCTVGTYNMDYRSWRSNLEVNVAVEDEGVASAMSARFRADIGRSTTVRLDDWRFRPLGERLFEQFFYLFRKLL
jgi:cardiolipin synthase